VKKRSEPEHLKAELREQVQRIERAQRERRTVLAQAASLGVLGLLLAIPIVAGAYLGRWLDSLSAGYSIRWTTSLIVLGVFLGAMNVYLQLRR
jgi:ATP synthase protein I